MIKAIKVLNAVSVLLFSVVLLGTYAYLPVMVDVQIDGVGDIHKQTLFYYFFAAFVVINILLRVGLSFFSSGRSEDWVAWIRTIIFVVNFYLSAIFGFIGVSNNTTSVSPEDFAYLNYLGPVFLGVWLVGLIFFLLKKKA